METILAPTDFSDNANNALFFAFELAKRSGAKVIILHTHKSGENEKMQSDLDQLKIGIEKQQQYNEVAWDFSIEPGDFIESIKKLQEQIAYDIIVMGTTGASGLKDRIMGTSTINVINKIRTPVLIIPEVTKFENLVNKGKNRVILASDFQMLNDENALDIFKEFVFLMNEPNVKILGVRPEGSDLTYIQQMERSRLRHFLEGVSNSRVTIFSDNVISGINFYLNKKKDTGLVAMVAKLNDKSIFHQSQTNEMAAYTKIPLLILHD